MIYMEVLFRSLLIMLILNIKTMKRTQWMIFMLLLAVAGCKNTPKEKTGVTLVNHKWELKTMMQADSVVKSPEKMPTLFFTDSTAVYGFAGCNNFFGVYHVEEDGGMILTPGGATMMACPDLVFEDSYLKSLNQVARYTIQGDELKLTDTDGKLTLIYVPVTE